MSNTAEIINFPNKTEQPGGRMADLSNGYTKVANEIQQLKPRLRLSGREWLCFEAVIWLTLGDAPFPHVQQIACLACQFTMR